MGNVYQKPSANVVILTVLMISQSVTMRATVTLTTDRNWLILFAGHLPICCHADVRPKMARIGKCNFDNSAPCKKLVPLRLFYLVNGAR